MTVSYRDIYNTGGGQFLDQLWSEGGGFRRTAAQTSATTPSVHLGKQVRLCYTLYKHVTIHLSNVPPFYLSSGGQGQRRLASGTHLTDEHSLQGFNHFGFVHTVGVAMTEFTCPRETRVNIRQVNGAENR